MTPEFILYSAMSIDGRIADAEGGVGWLDAFQTEDYGYTEFLASIDGLVMGRRTFDQVLAFGDWPYAGKPTLVLTHRPAPSEAPQAAEFASLDPAGVRGWAQARGLGRVWLVGGADVCGQFLAADRIDVMELFVMPVVLGAGPCLFESAGALRAFHLEDHRRWDSGVQAMTYRRRRG